MGLNLSNVRANEIRVEFFKRNHNKNNLDFSDYKLVYSLNGQLITFSCFEFYTDYGYPEGPILERDGVTMESLFESDANSLKNTFSDEFKSFSFLSNSHNLVKSYLLDELIQKEKVVNIDSIPSQIHNVLFLETGLKLSVLAVKDTDIFELVAII
ncbi:hypothetical protein ACWOAY_08670 [Granulicatella adiacens]|jgi:hypothetical protein|uniref:hypothetical protein n=1 Tax=Granulicatella adiacens TaxID=46124 RepID=UPI0021D881CF|nr:hypothetical protein [Granulicatella adiacens]UXY41085.1 hypothetical protein N8I82_07715 [Granulicatella adiacens]